MNTRKKLVFSFFYDIIIMVNDMDTRKTFKNLDEQIEILRSRGLVVTDEEKTKNILLRENYFFISGYRHLFMKSSKEAVISCLDNNLVSLSFFRPELSFLYGLFDKASGVWLAGNSSIYVA